MSFLNGSMYTHIHTRARTHTHMHLQNTVKKFAIVIAYLIEIFKRKMFANERDPAWENSAGSVCTVPVAECFAPLNPSPASLHFSSTHKV